MTFYSCSNQSATNKPISGWYKFPITLSVDSGEIYKSFSSKAHNGYYINTEYISYKNLTIDNNHLVKDVLSTDSTIMLSDIIQGTDARKWELSNMKNIKIGVPIFYEKNNIWSAEIIFNKNKKIKNDLKTLSLIVDPIDLFHYKTGIYVQGFHMNYNNPKIGNYSQRGADWTKKAALHLFENTNLIFQSGCKIKIQGDFSRSQPQKSFKLVFKEPVELNVFGTKNRFHRLILRTPFTSAPQGQSLLADSYLADIALSLGLDAMNSEAVNLYLNGEYWGLYHLREKIDEFYLQEKYSVTQESIDIVKFDSASEDFYTKIHGKKNDWLDLMEYIYENDVSNNNIYNIVCEKIDINNLIDYLIIQTFFANKDWPSNNFKFWKSSQIDNKWRFIVYDLDATFRNDNMFNYINSTKPMGNNSLESTILFRKLFKNKVFIEAFKSRYSNLLNHHLNKNNLIQKLNQREEYLRQAVPNQVSRWGMPDSNKLWEERVGKMAQYLSKREAQYTNHLNSLD